MSRFFVNALGGTTPSFYVAFASVGFATFCVAFATIRYYWLLVLLDQADFYAGNKKNL